MRLAKRNCSGFRCAAAIQAATVSRLLGNLKLDRPMGLLLHDDRTRRDPTAVDNIMDTDRNKIATTQFAVDS
jgi:hypothetical protein